MAEVLQSKDVSKEERKEVMLSLRRGIFDGENDMAMYQYRVRVVVLVIDCPSP